MYIGFWKRLAAYCIDSFIVYLLQIGFLTCFILVTNIKTVNIMSGKINPIYLGLAGLFSIIISWIYFASFESSPLMATLGKKAIDAKVVNISFCRISFSQATKRHFAKILSGLVLSIGYIMAAFTPKKQALHDIIIGTYVVKQ